LRKKYIIVYVYVYSPLRFDAAECYFRFLCLRIVEINKTDLSLQAKAFLI